LIAVQRFVLLIVFARIVEIVGAGRMAVIAFFAGAAAVDGRGHGGARYEADNCDENSGREDK
jgi:hypothetical protein